MKTITIVVEVDDDLNSRDFCEDTWIERVAEGLADVFDSIAVTDVREGDRLNMKSEHFSDRELAERGLPPFAWADDGIGNVIRLERGMMGFFPTGLTLAMKANVENGVSPEQAEAMHMGSMFGWGVPGAFPKKLSFSSHPIDVLTDLAGSGLDPAKLTDARKFLDENVEDPT